MFQLPFRTINNSLSLVLILSLLACSEQNQDPSLRKRPSLVSKLDSATNCKVEQLNILNGKVSEESEYPAVVMIENNAFCTATWIAKNLLLTAAHCVQNQEISIEINGKKLTPTHYELNSGFPTPPAGSNSSTVRLSDIKYDTALLWFEKDTVSDYRSICTKTITRGDEVELVGYGKFNDGTDRIKRSGTNKISSVNLDGYFELLTNGFNKNDRGNHAVSESGDSGGPMFFGECIQGTVSGGKKFDLFDTKFSFYTDLSSKASRALLDKYPIGEDYIPPSSDSIPYENVETKKLNDSDYNNNSEDLTDEGC